MTAIARPDARFYDDLRESTRAFHARIDEVSSGADVIELGCGAEAVAFDIAASAASVLGVSADLEDVEEARVEAARRGLTNLRFAAMSPEDLRVADHSVDLVVGVSSLHRLDIAQAYAEIARVLRPGGRAVLLEPLGHNPVINAYRRRTESRRHRFEHPIRREELSLASRWFASVDVQTHHLLDRAAVSVGHGIVGRSLRTMLRRTDRVLLGPSSPLRWHAWIAVVVLEKPRS